MEIEGIEELMRNLQELGRDVDQAKKRALNKGADFMYDRVKENTRYRTGNLQESIEKKVSDDEAEVFIDQQGPGFYGYFLEIGRKGGVVKRGRYKGKRIPPMPPYPFMGPAYENNKDKLQDIIANEIRRDLGL